MYTDDSHGWDIIIYRYTNGEYQELSNDRVTLKDNENIDYHILVLSLMEFIM